MEKILRICLIGLGLVGSLQWLPAQNAATANGGLPPIQAWPADTVINDTAQAQGLHFIPPDQVPPWGTFWIFSEGGILPGPLPCPPGDASLPIFAIADGQFLVGDAADPAGANAALLTAQANAVANLIAQVQSASASQPMFRAMDDSPLVPGGGGDSGDGGALNTNSYVFTPNTNE